MALDELVPQALGRDADQMSSSTPTLPDAILRAAAMAAPAPEIMSQGYSWNAGPVQPH